MKTELELRVKEIQLVGARLVAGREYPIKEGFKLKYFGLVESQYDHPKQGGRLDTWVHRFVIGKIKNGKVIAIAQVEILRDNLQVSPDGTVKGNSETKYPARYYFLPTDKDEIKRANHARLAKFARFNSFLMEESK